MNIFQKLKAAWRPFSRPMIGMYAASVSFHLLLSALPTCVLLLTLLPSLTHLLLDPAKIVGSSTEGHTLLLWLTERASAAYPSMTFSISLLFTLWSASKGVLALLDGMDACMRVERSVGFFLRHMIAITYFIILTIALLISLVILVFGRMILKVILWNLSPDDASITKLYQLRIFAAILILGTLFGLMYRLLPAKKQAFGRCMKSGFCVAVAWVVFSMLFSIYVDNFSALPKLYGSIGGLALTAVWMRICITVLLYGAILLDTLSYHDL